MTPFSWIASEMHLHSKDNHREWTLAKYRQSGPVILPSLLQCDFANLQRELETLETAGIKAFHLDVMDGHFVPNLSYGMPILASLRKVTEVPLDVHLMISEPAKYVDAFIEAGADSITFHIEAKSDPTSLLKRIREAGVMAGLAINPKTDLSLLFDSIDLCDFVLIMSVEAGFGGQAFHSNALDRLSHLRREYGEDLLLEVDGGVNASTIAACIAAGADMIVVGSAIFGKSCYADALNELDNAIQSVIR